MFRRDDYDALEPLEPDEVEVEVAAMGLTASDGADDSTSSATR